MFEPMARSTALGLAALLAACGTSGRDGLRENAAIAEAPYLSRAHSHNDYEQRSPLSGALSRTFASVEVDVVLLDGELYVAHGPDAVDRGVTLRGAYLDPLRGHVERAGGRGYGHDDPPLQLMVDVKTDAYATYAALHDVLREYSDILTTWEGGRRTVGAVTVVISGNRPVDRLGAEATRYAALDGRVLDDREGLSPEVMPLVSEDWEKLGPPGLEARLARAGRIVDQMHGEGRKVRFWGTPEDEALWGALVALGVDYIGTDDVSRLDGFLRRGSGESGSPID